MDSENNFFGCTGGGANDCFNTPVDQDGYSILTGETKGARDPEDLSTLVALQTYKVRYY